MRNHLERDLDGLHRRLLALAGAVEDAVRDGLRALRGRDAALAHRVIDGDGAIDREENRVEEECLKVLALHQPLATDLRRVVAALKINTDLERMADLAVNIAERAVALAGMPPVEVPAPFGPMAERVAAMLRRSLDAFVNLDAALARRVIGLDDEVDRYHREAVGELIEAMRAAPAGVPAWLSLLSAAGHLERIADHATNVAEDVVYLVEGAIARHRSAARDPD
jgi:phosphate transport system protein